MGTKLTFKRDEAAVSAELCSEIQKFANEAIDRNGKFVIGVSGGSVAKFLCSGLPSLTTDWSKWIIVFCDERLVSFDCEDSTYGVYRAGLIGKSELKESNFVTIDPSLSAEDAAIDYEKKLKDIGYIDVVILGVGPDGHICSLFPGHPLLQETDRWVASLTDSPKPPPSRVTLTLPVINNVRVCIFALAGKGKADMIKRILIDKDDVPASLVKPTEGQLIWILDEDAAHHVKTLK